MPTAQPTRDASSRGLRLLVLLVLALVLAALVGARATSADAKPRTPYKVPRDARIERDLGIRVSQAKVVAGGGIIQIDYVVLDPEKASRFQANTVKPPVLRSDRRNVSTFRAAMMRQGHLLRAGQTYSVLYLNKDNGIRRGETLTIDSGSAHLAHVPVR